MKKMSSSSSTSWDDSLSSWSSDGEEDERYDIMSIAEFTQSRQSITSHITPNPPTKVAVDHAEGSTSGRGTLSDHSKAKSCAMERAEAVKANLDPNFPNFVKSMARSNVSDGFWLGLPIQFCNAHLPNRDTMVKLIDEDEKQYTVKYIVEKIGLSAGWRTFSIVHKLVEGDALVFQLINPTEFQVYIIRAYSNAEIDGTFSRLRLDVHAKRIRSCKRVKSSGETEKKCPKTLKLVAHQQPGGKSRSGSEEVGSSEVTEGARYLETNVHFKEIKNLKSFVAAVKVISDLSEAAQTKYYRLCRSQNLLLHENISERINSQLTAGIISQTVEIADNIRSSKLSTSRDEFAAWDQSLDVLEQLGMNVGFLRARIKKLVNLVYESEEAVNSKRYREALAGRALVKEEIRTVEEKLIELEKTCRRFETELKTLKVKTKIHELKFQAEVDAPW